MPVNKCDGCEALDKSNKYDSLHEKLGDIGLIENKAGELYLVSKEKNIAIKAKDAVEWFWETYENESDDDDLLEEEGQEF